MRGLPYTSHYITLAWGGRRFLAEERGISFENFFDISFTTSVKFLEICFSSQQPMLSTYPFHEKSVPIPPTIPMFSCTKGLREKKMVRFSPKTHESDGLGTDSRGMKGGQPPKSGKFWGNSLTQPRSKGYFGKFLFLGQQGKFLKRFREINARPKARSSS